jgi:hypothetical protein
MQIFHTAGEEEGEDGGIPQLCYLDFMRSQEKMDFFFLKEVLFSGVVFFIFSNLLCDTQ